METRLISNEQISKDLAEKLMGFTLVDEYVWEGPTHQEYHLQGVNKDLHQEDCIPEWNPCENIEQAFRCLEKFGSFDVGKYGTQWEENIHENYYCCRVLKHGGRNDNPSDSITEYGSTPALAISRACLAAITKAGEK